MKKWILLAGGAVVCAVVVLAVRGRTTVESAQSEPAASVEVVDRAGGAGGLTYAVDADGARAVFGRGNEVVVVDVADPSDPRELRAVPLPGAIRDLKLRGNWIYAAADSAGLQILDLEQAAVAGSLGLDDRAYGVDVDGDRVYVAARSQGLRIIDASDASNPKEIGHLITPDEAVAVQVRGTYAYVAAWYESMRVIDVSDPTDPVDVSFAPFSSYDHGAVWAVAVDGNLGLAAVPEKGLRTVDVTEPREVKNHTMYRRLHAPAGAALKGRTAYVADQDAGLRVLDLTDPSNPVEIGALYLPGRVIDVHVSGATAYVAAREAGLRLIDVSVPNAPRQVGFVDADDAIVDVASTGRTLLAAGAENGVYRYEGGGRLTRQLHAPAEYIEVDEIRIVTAGPGGLIVYEEDRPVGAVEGAVHGVAASGDVMAAAGPLGVRILDAAGGSLHEVGLFEPSWSDSARAGRLTRTPPVAWDVRLRGHLAYVASDAGIYVIDLADRRNPTAVGFLETSERVYRLDLSGEKLLAACDDGLRVVDVSNPSQPAEIAHTKTPSFATALLVDAETVYVGDLDGNVMAARVADGRVVGTWEVADRVYALARTEHGLAVAAGSQGLLIVALNDDNPEAAGPAAF